MENLSGKKRRVLVLVEREDQEVNSITYELISIGKKVSNTLQGILCAAVPGDRVMDTLKQIALFVDEVYSIHHPLLERFQAEFYADALQQLCRQVNPDLLIMGHTLDNLDLAPRLAYKMGAQIVTDCVDLTIEPETGHLECTKPVYGAKIIASFRLIKKPCVVTMRPKAIEPVGPGPGQGEIIPFDPTLEKSSTPLVLFEEVKEESIGLDKAEAIVAGGRGIKDADGLRQLEEFVKVLRNFFKKVEMGASRPLVDMHLVPTKRQIGLTGEKVAPELYIAIGISGSLQHMTGMLGSKNIIAINNNPKAPIFGVAHYGVIDNFEEVVPAIIRKLKELQ
jgi:electron transfer flavoprotein alpha subunit